MKITLKLEGDDEIIRKIKILEEKCSEGLKTAILKSVIYVEREAKNTTAWSNVDNILRPSITHEVVSKGNKHQGKVGTNVFYGPHLEFGTVKMSARPWLLPALKNSRDMIIRFLTEAIKAVKP